MGTRNFAASNKPKTCLWCGRTLRGMKDGDAGGDASENFDTLGCAAAFGDTFANAGRRLKPVVPEVVAIEGT